MVLAFITSRFPDEMLETDLLIESRHPSFAAIGLRVASTLRIHRLVTASASIVLRELGELPPDLQAEVGRKLRILFAL